MSTAPRPLSPAEDELLLRFLVERLGCSPTSVVVSQRAERLRRLTAQRRHAGDRLDLLLELTSGSGSSELHQAAVAEFTIGETWLFRDPDAFACLRERVFPSLLERPVVRIWSAGCSTGEEPRSLAHTAAECGLDAVSILSTDVCEQRLERARSSHFSRDSIRDPLPETFRWQEGEGVVIPTPERAQLQFVAHNLASGSVPEGAPFDLIVCRNVLMYLQPVARRRAIGLFGRALSRRGWLILGPHDFFPPGEIPSDLRRQELPYVYRRVGERAPTSPPASPASKPRPRAAASRPRPPAPGPGVEALLRDAHTRLAGGDEVAAETACLRALDLDPHCVDAIVLLSRIALDRHEVELARILLESAIEENAGEPQLLAALERVRARRSP